MIKNSMRNALIFLVAVLLSSCGGDSGGIGSGGTGATSNTVAGVQLGAVSGFGSIIIEGNKYDDSIASFTTETEPGNAQVVTSSAIKLGMQIKATFDTAEKLKSITPSPIALGLVSAVNGNIITVAGQTINVQTASTTGSALTIFEGLSGLSDISIGDRLEVYGQRDSADAIIATRIEQLDSASSVVRVNGPVSGYSDSATPSFKVANLTVLTNSTTKRLPSATTIKNGDLVSVWSSGATNAAGTILTAKVIRVEDSNADATAPWRVGGPIRDLDVTAKTIRISQVLVDYSAAQFSGGVVGDLKAGVLTRAIGTANTLSNGNRVLKASTIELLKTPASVKIELLGAISDFSSASSFRVRGTLVNASANSVNFSNGSSANLADGVLVSIEGIIANGIIEPTKLEFKTTADVSAKAFVGTISNYNGVTGDFAITGLGNSAASVAARLTNTTQYQFFTGGVANISNFITIANTPSGSPVLVNGNFVSGIFIVDEVRLGSQAIKEVKIEGVAYQVNTVNRTLIVNGIPVTWQTSTSINALASLRNGALVKIEGLVSNLGGGNANVAASKIDVKAR